MGLAVTNAISTINTAIGAGKSDAIFSASDYVNHTATRNTNGFFYGITGLSAVSMTRGDGTFGNFRVHLISQNFCIAARHVDPSSGTFYWVQDDNTVISRTITDVRAIGFDIVVCKLSAPITTIAPFYILPDNYAAKMGVTGRGFPFYWTGQDNTVRIYSMYTQEDENSFHYCETEGPTDASWLPFSSLPNSSNAGFIVVDGKAILLTCVRGPQTQTGAPEGLGAYYCGESYQFYASNIEAAMVSMGSSDTLTRADLSGFDQMYRTIGAGGDDATFDDFYNGQIDTPGDLVGKFLAGANVVDFATQYDLQLMSCSTLTLSCASVAGPTTGIASSVSAACITGGFNLVYGDSGGPTSLTIDGVQLGHASANGQIIIALDSPTTANTLVLKNLAMNFGADAGAGNRQLISISGGGNAKLNATIQNCIMAKTASQTGAVTAAVLATTVGFAAANGLSLNLYHNSINATGMTRGIIISANTGTTCLVDSRENTVCGSSTADMVKTGTGTITLNGAAGRNVTSDTTQSNFGSGGTSGASAATEWASATDFSLKTGAVSRGNGTTAAIPTDRINTVRPSQGLVDAGAVQVVRATNARSSDMSLNLTL